MRKKSDDQFQPGGRLAPNPTFGSTRSDLDRICPNCDGPLPLVYGEGALACCECARCGRPVKPRLRTAVERATKFRDSLRLLVRLQTAPERVVEEVFAELDRELWTSLSGIDGEPFKTFEAFCLDPKGLGCDPGPVKALIVKLRGHNATKLLTVPQRRQGQRNDLEATSRPKGEKLRKTPGNHTRCRSILGGPPNVERAFRSRQLSEKDSASLSSYALRNPDCPKLKAILLDLGNVPATASPRAVLKDLRGRIRELSAAGGRSKKALAPEQRPPSSSTSTPDISTVTASLGSGGAENQAVQVSLARDHERVGDADDVRADSGTNGLTTTREVALLRFLGGWLDLKRLGLGGVDPAALREILWEVSAAGNLPEIRRTLREFELLCEVAELVKVLDPAFPNYADLCKIATREASPVPATIDGARDEVARRLKFPGAVKKAHPSRETKTANVT